MLKKVYILGNRWLILPFNLFFWLLSTFVFIMLPIKSRDVQDKNKEVTRLFKQVMNFCNYYSHFNWGGFSNNTYFLFGGNFLKRGTLF